MEQLSPGITTMEPESAAATEAHEPRARALQQVKSLQWEAWAPQWRVAPCLSQLQESLCAAMKTQHNQKKKNTIFFNE